MFLSQPGIGLSTVLQVHYEFHTEQLTGIQSLGLIASIYFLLASHITKFSFVIFLPTPNASFLSNNWYLHV